MKHTGKFIKTDVVIKKEQPAYAAGFEEVRGLFPVEVCYQEDKLEARAVEAILSAFDDPKGHWIELDERHDLARSQLWIGKAKNRVVLVVMKLETSLLDEKPILLVREIADPKTFARGEFANAYVI